MSECERCGVERKQPRKNTTLCRDCRGALTPSEQEAWKQ